VSSTPFGQQTFSLGSALPILAIATVAMVVLGGRRRR
jgi:hypothetical protein